MRADSDLAAVALDAMTHVLDLDPSDSVLVVTDEPTVDCGRAFAAAARRHGCDVATWLLPEDERPLTAMPPEMADLLEDRTVVVNAIIGDVREVPFRLEWLGLVEESPVIRMGHCPGIDLDMMTGGPMDVDYGAMQERAEELFAAFADAVSVHITTDLGTDLHLDLTDRKLISDLKSEPGCGVNLPCGEAYCAPLENGADGRLVVDGCFGSWGNLDAPATFTLEGGRVTDVTCDDAPALAEILRILETDAGARTIAELGIGLNPGARLTDNMLEAEKAGGTAHIAFGANKGLAGGVNESQVHVDYLFKSPRMKIKAADGSEREIVL
ncbi:MAG: aminopeptidase [bacterium]|nr:aminopeptidase [bacterium]